MIKSQQQWLDSGLGQHTDPAALLPPIDWSQDMVIAVLAGTKSSGGHSIRIESMDVGILPPPPPSPGHPPPLGIPHLRVKYRETAPDGPALTVITAPFHMVVCPRFNGIITFESIDAPAAQEVRGRVRVINPTTVRLEAAGSSYLVSPVAQARALARFPGRTVRVEGTLQPGPQGDVIVEVSRLLSPERTSIEGFAQVKAGRPIILHGHPLSTMPMREVRTFGPAGSALRAAEGTQVTCDAFVFTDATGQPTEAYLESVGGEARQYSALKRSASLVGWSVGYVRPGEAVAVLRVYGPMALVRGSHGQGWLRRSRVQVGDPFVPESVTPGFVGSVPGE